MKWWKGLSSLTELNMVGRSGIASIVRLVVMGLFPGNWAS